MVSRDPENPSLGGGEVVFAEWSRQLVRAGHTVDYLCSTFPSAAAEAEFDGVRVHRLSGELTLGPSAFWEYWRRYRGKVDVILEEMLGGSRIPFFAPLYAREPVIGAWFQDHGPIFRNQYPRVLWPFLDGLEQALVNVHRQSVVLVPSHRSAASLVRKGGDPARLRVYRPGISGSLLALGPPPSFGERKPWLIYLGKIRRYKRAEDAIHVLARLGRDVPDAELVIAGRMGQVSYYDELRRIAASNGLSGRVRFEVNITDQRKTELLRSARVLLSPAPIEGFGIAIVEAGACGAPVVGTDGIPEEVLVEGVNGFRVPFADIPAMADRARRLLTEPAVFARCSTGAYELAVGSTWANAAQPLLDLLGHRLLRSGPAPGGTSEDGSR